MMGHVSVKLRAVAERVCRLETNPILKIEIYRNQLDRFEQNLLC